MWIEIINQLFSTLMLHVSVSHLPATTYLSLATKMPKIEPCPHPLSLKFRRIQISAWGDSTRTYFEGTAQLRSGRKLEGNPQYLPVLGGSVRPFWRHLKACIFGYKGDFLGKSCCRLFFFNMNVQSDSVRPWLAMENMNAIPFNNTVVMQTLRNWAMPCGVRSFQPLVNLFRVVYFSIQFRESAFSKLWPSRPGPKFC